MSHEALKLLFNDLETIACCDESTAFTQHEFINTRCDIDDKFTHFKINPYKDRYVSSVGAANLSSMRNFLIEWDNIPLDEQTSLIDKLKIPYATVTFSGSKSFHVIISLTINLKDIINYKTIAHGIYDAIVEACNIPPDKSSLEDPAKYSRMPNNYRHKGKKVLQELVKIGKRTSPDELQQWLKTISNVDLQQRYDDYLARQEISDKENEEKAKLRARQAVLGFKTNKPKPEVNVKSDLENWLNSNGYYYGKCGCCDKQGWTCPLCSKHGYCRPTHNCQIKQLPGGAFLIGCWHQNTHPEKMSTNVLGLIKLKNQGKI